jgi:heme/copper-type cytochrome/quinol oxidase subunit 2
LVFIGYNRDLGVNQKRSITKTFTRFMKYIFLRIVIIILGMAFIYHISDYIQDNTEIEDGGYNFEGIIWFFRLLLAFVLICLSVFGYEARLFHKQNKKKQRNISLTFIGVIILLMLLFSGYFSQFV